MSVRPARRRRGSRSRDRARPPTSWGAGRSRRSGGGRRRHGPGPRGLARYVLRPSTPVLSSLDLFQISELSSIIWNKPQTLTWGQAHGGWWTMAPQTLAEKVWEEHVVRRQDGEPDLLFVDLHLVHEVTSPQAFDGLRMHGRTVRRPELTVATMDHNVPTTAGPVTDETSARQMEALRTNASEFGITLYPWGGAGQGIVHVIGPEMGYTQPGMMIVCGDSHTSTHGALGALAIPIGTSEVEHVLATQTLPQKRTKTMAVSVDGDLPAGCSAKDVILGIINRIG